MTHFAWLRIGYHGCVVCLLDMAFDELDRTTRYIVDAKARASAMLDEHAPRLTALEKAIWLKLKREASPGPR